jgi:hypothetical protein
MKTTNPNLINHAPISIALNYLNWDSISKTISGKNLILEDFIAEIDIAGLDHKEQGKNIWVNILFKKSDDTKAAKALTPVYLEVTATKGFKDVLVTRKDIRTLSNKLVLEFVEDTKKFFELFELELFPTPQSNVDRAIIFNNDKKTLHVGNEKGIDKTMFVHADEKQEQIKFILSYLGLAASSKNKFNIFANARKALGRLLNKTH